MVFPVVGGTQDTSYEIENSLRFNTSDTARLGKTISGTSNRKTFSMSFWLKKTKLSGNGGIFGVGTASSDSGKLQIRIDGSDNLKIEGGATTFRVTDREFRDVSAWYNIFISFDSTQSTADNRILIYVNGVQETSFSTSNNPSQDANTPFNEDGKTHYIGTEGDGSSAALDGYLAEFHYIDGAKKAYTDFGEFDNNGVWIPKKYDGSYGTHGFYFQFKQTGTSANSSGMGADTSGNDNHYTPNNLAATDVTEDTPTNNFATMNPLSPTQGTPAYAEGNLKISASGAVAYSYFPSTFGLSNGKWYAEVKVNSQGGNTFIGIAETSMEAYYTGAGNDPHLTAGTIWYANGGNGYYDGSSQDASTFGAASFTSGDIIGLALDLDSGTRTIKFYKNGSLTTTKNLTSNFVDPIVFAANLFNTQNQSWNFGNPDFSISSGNADANGYGNFEYAPPSGYYACCTKNLAEYG